MYDESQRGQGFTTLQMQRAPQGACYFWPNHISLRYAIDLAKRLGREDLIIVPFSRLQDGLRGFRASAFIVDHAINLTLDEVDKLRQLRAMRAYS